MKPSHLRWFLFIALVPAALCFSAPAFGQDTADLLSKALDLVHQVEKPSGNPPTDAQRIDLLTQAIKMAQKAPNHRLKQHRVLAIQAIRGAIAEIRSGDPDHKAAGYLHTADTELSSSVALAAATEPSTKFQEASALPSSSPSGVLPSIPAPAAVDKNDTALPPGVTPEMEQAFLEKYKAAVEKQDSDAYFSLLAMDPGINPKVKAQIKDFIPFSLALDASNPNRTYSFVPIPPEQKDKPSEFDGKMYDDYLPAMIVLKITFVKPAHPSSNDLVVSDATFPLCIENHQLMLCGFKEIPGAVPPPAVDKAANFGIEPNLRKLGDKAESEGENGFASLDEFLASLKQPGVEILDSGEGKFEYYAICRIAPNLCVWAGGDKVGESNYSFYFRATDSNKQELKGSQKWIRLVDIPTDNGQAPNVQGTVFFVPDHYTGPITIDPHYSDDAGNKVPSVSQTVDWK